MKNKLPFVVASSLEKWDSYVVLIQWLGTPFILVQEEESLNLWYTEFKWRRKLKESGHRVFFIYLEIKRSEATINNYRIIQSSKEFRIKHTAFVIVICSIWTNF